MILLLVHPLKSMVFLCFSLVFHGFPMFFPSFWIAKSPRSPPGSGKTRPRCTAAASAEPCGCQRRCLFEQRWNNGGFPGTRNGGLMVVLMGFNGNISEMVNVYITNWKDPSCLPGTSTINGPSFNHPWGEAGFRHHPQWLVIHGDYHYYWLVLVSLSFIIMLF